MHDHYPWTVDYNHKKLAILNCSGLVYIIKTKKNFTSVHIRNHLRILWTCMSILVRGGSLLVYYTRGKEEPLFRGILENGLKNIS